ncbi:protein kinase domain-containing protein [Sorangium sp. So ce1389]|uniref:serine/threonine-protein kinase n=1 Tax=Sorangium sp. So ce1389 TaxID=3133336 RepID=UPI003F62C972
MDGTTLNGRYILGRLLGKGGMGAVYEADDVELQRRVAVKVIRPELAHGRSALGRFEREAKAASAVQTEHIVRVLDAGVDRETGSPFLVMELLRGEDLAELLDRLGPLPPRLALRIVAQACVGLQKAHAAGVLHRDIKPANLFLARREEGGGIVVKLLDFGVAKIRPVHDPLRDTTGLTRSGHVLGTPRYMSPEQARGIKDVDHRTDLWSLGVVLYRALAGRTPTDDVETVGDLIAALVADLPTPVQTFAPWVSPEVAAAVDGALQYQPADRYPSASAMLEALMPLLGEEPLSLDESMLVPLEPSERLTVAPPFEPRVRSRPPRRSMVGAGGAERWKDLPTGSAMALAHGTTLSQDYRQDYRVDERPPSQPAPPPPRRLRGLPLSALALLAAGLGWAAMSRSADAPGAASTGVQRAIRGALEAPSVQGPAPSPALAPSTVARRLRLANAHEEASVEIDGVPATLKDGMVELPGTPGTVHKVRVLKRHAEIEMEVTVTDGGAIAVKRKQVSRRDAGSPARKPRPAATASAPPDAARAPADTGDPLMPQRFQ